MKASRITLLLSTATLIFITSNLNWYGENWKDYLESDAKGYFAYLPAVFVYQDLNFGFFEEIQTVKYKHNGSDYDYRIPINDTYVNKYFCGTALVSTPFYLIAHWLSSVWGFDQDGYSYLYMVSQTIAAVFYCLLGLFFIMRLMELYRISDINIAISVVTILFGSNLFYYTVGELGMSHVYSFAFISIFLYSAKSYVEFSQSKHLIISAAALGLITLIRPVNILIVLSLPFLAGNLSSLLSLLKTLFLNKRTLIFSVLLFLFIVSIQLIIYKIQTGSFFIYSYRHEGFNFLHPEIFNFLFSYQKGLFVYTPIYLIAILGIIPFYKENKFQAFSLLLFLSIIIYVLSSWWCWFYGGSFSTRVFVEFLPLFALLVGGGLQWAKKWFFKGYVTLLFLVIVLCQIQTFQYRYYQIHWAHMTKEKYWDVFLRVDKLP